MYIAVYKYLYEGREMAKKSQHFNDYFKYPLKYSFFFFSFYFFFFEFILAVLCCMGDLNSPARDQTCTPAVEAQHPNYWTVREVPLIFIYFLNFNGLYQALGETEPIFKHLLIHFYLQQ